MTEEEIKELEDDFAEVFMEMVRRGEQVKMLRTALVVTILLFITYGFMLR